MDVERLKEQVPSQLELGTISSDADELNLSSGEMTEEELNEFLYEIERDDDDLLDAQQDAAEKESDLNSIAEAETNKRMLPKDIDEDLLPEERMTDCAWFEFDILEKDGSQYKNGFGYQLYSEMREKTRERMRLAVQRSKEASLRRKQRKIEIQREAFNQTVVDLNARVPDAHFKLLISALTRSYSSMMAKYEAYINKRMTMLLRPFIPKILKLSLKRYPQAMLNHPGFMYIASKEYGSGLKMWVKPDIPYYIAQGKEMEILRKYKADYLFAVDKAVQHFYANKAMLAEKEVTYASRLIGRRTNTYFGLLKLNPFWFEILVNELRAQQEQ